MKKFFPIILSLIIALSIVGFVLAKDGINETEPALSDGTPPAPPSDWAKESVAKAKSLKIINADVVYPYRMSINREKFCELIYNYCSMAGEPPVDDGNIVFEDTDNIKVQILNAMGIINGKSATKFAPNDLLTREEAATILFRMIDAVHSDWAAHQIYYEFADSKDISDWAMDSVQTICNMGIMKGVGNKKFAPKDTFTTEQAIATIVRIHSSFNQKQEAGKWNNLTFADKLNLQMPQDKNYMFSPLSIKMALALSANGALGETESEILNAIEITDLDEFNSYSKELIESYSKTDVINLSIANSIWINRDKTSQKFSNSFKEHAIQFYNAEVKSINNSTAVNEINFWVNDKTKGKISKIIESPDDFWAMLINAIYFKGEWQDEFSEYATKPDDFNNADGTKKTVDFMNKTKWFPYTETKSLKVLKLPYKNRVDKVSEKGEFLGTEKFDDLDVSMYLIMADGDINVEEELSAAINDNAFKSTYIKMSMPKFQFEFETNLNDILKNMGIISAFQEETAEFHNMFDKGNMWFTNTLHKTYISVDEKGTEAAAVTSIGMAGSSLPPEPIILKFDKPFYFVIRDNLRNETLFMGRHAFAS